MSFLSRLLGRRATVLHYTGHRILAKRKTSRFPARREADIAKAVARLIRQERVSAGYGGLASGSDILFAEALLACGADLHIVLACDTAHFIAASVAEAGPNWVTRFHGALAQATSVTFSGSDEDTDIDYGAATRLALDLGEAAAQLSRSNKLQIAIFDGQAGTGDAGTGADIERAGQRDWRQIVVKPNRPRPVLSGAWFKELSNDLFLTVLYFTFSAPVDAAGSNVALHAARFLAPLATVSAIVKIVIEAAYASWLQAQLKNQHNHIVVVGFGALGQQIARQFLQDGRRVVVLERQPSSDAAELAAHLSIPLVVGDPTRSEDLNEVAARRAGSIFFVTDNDIVNLEACAAASDLMSKADRTRTHLMVHLGNAQLSHQIQDYERRIAFIGDKRTAVSFFNLNDLLARQLLMENPLHRTAHWLCQERLHVLIIGLNDISRKIIFHTLLSQRTHNLGAPHFTILDPEATRGRKDFEAAWPGIADIATTDFIDASLDAPHIETLIRDASRAAPLTATVLCLQDEIENLTAALRIHSAAARGQIHAGNIMVRRDQTSDFFERLSRIERFDLANMLVDFGEGDHQLFVRQITGEDDILARRIHDAYCAQRTAAGDPPSPSTAPWEVLPESSRRANRRAADFVWTKLGAVGYRIKGSAGALPHLTDTAARLEEETIVAQLARLEHDRWWADRVVDGWRQGPVRDNEALVHPDLRPFDDLDFETQSKDEEQNNFITQMLKETGTKKSEPTPIERAIGVEFRAHCDTECDTEDTIDSDAGLPGDHAAKLKSQFPGEAFMVLSEARTKEQEIWLKALVEALGTKTLEARFIRLFQAGSDETLETLDADDQTLWLNLQAAGSKTKNGYPHGMSVDDFLTARADHTLVVSV